jgi:hypothetical protein
MGEEKKQKPPGFEFNRKDFDGHTFDAFRYGMGLGIKPEFMDSLHQAFQAGIIGGGPPMAPFTPEPFPIAPQEPRKIKDLADEKIAELKRRLQLESMERRRLEVKLDSAKIKIRRLEQDNNDLALEKLQSFGRPAVPEIIKKYLKFLIFACHPDRNPGREEAAEVTKALLDLRGKK